MFLLEEWRLEHGFDKSFFQIVCCEILCYFTCILILNEIAKEEGLVKELKTPFYNQGKEEGQMVRARSEILRSVSRAKGSLPPSDIREIVEDINDLNVLDLISDKIWGITNWEEIERIIRKYGNETKQ